MLTLTLTLTLPWPRRGGRRPAVEGLSLRPLVGVGVGPDGCESRQHHACHLLLVVERPPTPSDDIARVDAVEVFGHADENRCGYQ